MQHYELKFNKEERRIDTVINKDFGPVEFDSNQIDQEAGIIVGGRVKVYTTLIQRPFGNDVAEILNIIHIHLQDLSEFTSLDVVYLKKGETKQDHLEFKVDEMGVMLRYKILVKNLTIFDILYNTGSSIESVPFEEVRFEVGEKYTVTGVEDLSLQPLFSTV